jgi:hypothetical protein
MDQKAVSIVCGADVHGPAHPDSINAPAIHAPAMSVGILVIDIGEDIL